MPNGRFPSIAFACTEEEFANSVIYWKNFRVIHVTVRGIYGKNSEYCKWKYFLRQAHKVLIAFLYEKHDHFLNLDGMWNKNKAKVSLFVRQ